VNSVGPESLIFAASRFITSKDAPTYGARSICRQLYAHDLLMTRQRAKPGRCRTHLVDDQKVRLGDTWSAFSRNLVTARDVDNVDNVVCQFSRIVGYESALVFPPFVPGSQVFVPGSQVHPTSRLQ